MPGVHAVFTAADIPGELMVGIIYKDWPVMIPLGGRTSYAGDVLAIVIADTREHARSATQHVVVDYTVHKPITDPVVALQNAEIAVWKTENNVLSTSRYERGDTSTALQDSEFVVEETFVTQRIEHAFLEPESTVAVPASDGKSLHVYSGGQGIWDDRNDIAKLLNLDNSQVTVELVTNGGAFGGKEDMSNQAHTALSAWLLQTPVKCTLSREESLLMHAKRHPITMKYKASCDKQGKLTALHVRAIGDSGAYASVGMKVLERVARFAGLVLTKPSLRWKALLTVLPKKLASMVGPCGN
jgi:CO/xanthine dehydrogenase Mo-binding subunit